MGVNAGDTPTEDEELVSLVCASGVVMVSGV